MKDSQRLLADYAANGSEEAFRELVRLHLDLVYSTALRLVRGDAPLAEDIAQTVFVDLARKARALPPEVRLAGWLHRHTCFVGSKIIRSEHRRRSRERQAVEMNSLHDDSESTLTLVAPILDEAINQLRPDDRAAIMLRFFERRDLRSVGEALGASENAAQKRVVRALETLRVILKRRGVACSAAALGAALSAGTVKAAPAALAASIANAALLNIPAQTGFTIPALKLMTASNLKTAFLAAVVLASLVTPLAVYQQAHARLRDQQEAFQRTSSDMAGIKIKNQPAPGQPVSAASSNSLSRAQFLELLRLRGELGGLQRDAEALQRAKAFRDADARLSADQVWPTRENRLKQWLDQHPSQKIPELSQLSDKSWLNSIYPFALETDEDCRRAMTVVRDNADAPTRNNLAVALRNYVAAQNGQWPTDVSQLQPYLTEPLDDAILNRYAVFPASSLAPELQTGSDWAITEKAPIDEFDDRYAIGLTNSAFANSRFTNRWSVMQ